MQHILELLDEIRADLEPVTSRSPTVTAMANILVTPRFLVSESFQHTVAAGVSPSSVSGVLYQVFNAMSCRMGRCIRCPHTQDALNETKHCFNAVAGFPKVIGVIDCSLVQLVPP